MRIDILQKERAFLLINGRPERYLTPGRYRIFRPFSRVEVLRVPATELFADLDASFAALVPDGELTTITLQAHQRAG